MDSSDPIISSVCLNRRLQKHKRVCLPTEVVHCCCSLVNKWTPICSVHVSGWAKRNYDRITRFLPTMSFMAWWHLKVILKTLI